MTLTLRNVPDSIHRVLKEQARRNRRSLNQEALAVFERVLATERPSREAEIAEIIKRTDRARARMKSFPSAQEIDDSIEEGRL